MTAEVGAARHSLSVADLAAWVRLSAALVAEYAEEPSEPASFEVPRVFEDPAEKELDIPDFLR